MSSFNIIILSQLKKSPRIPDLGVLRARQLVLTKNSTVKEVAASPCVNPVVDRWWDFRGHNYHVKGLHKSVEEVKERNGPFAGKRGEGFSI